MKFPTVLKISEVWLLALVVELVLAYLIFSNYAFSLAETGQYHVRTAYAAGPMARVAKVFYAIFSVTSAVGLGALLFDLLSLIFRRRSGAH